MDQLARYRGSLLGLATGDAHQSDNFRDGCLLAVNLGDDADTTGAIYGQLAGAFYAVDGIPKSWRLKLARRELIEKLRGAPPGSFAEARHRNNWNLVGTNAEGRRKAYFPVGREVDGSGACSGALGSRCEMASAVSRISSWIKLLVARTTGPPSR